MQIRIALAVLILALAACHSSSPHTIEEKLATHAGKIMIGDPKDLALSKLSALDMTCKEWPIEPAAPGIVPDKRFTQIICRRNNPNGAKETCHQSVHLMIYSGLVNQINTQTSAVGGVPPEWSCSGR